MSGTSSTDGRLDAAVALLERTPRTLEALLGGLPSSWLGEPDVPGGWTAKDVIGHLITAELSNWIPRVETLLEHGTNRPLGAFDRFAHVERDAAATLPELLARFAELRAANLVRLRQLVREGDLDRLGLHPEFGEVRLSELLAAWTVHDLDHAQQVFSALAASQDAAVGPWKAFLGILLRREGAVS